MAREPPGPGPGVGMELTEAAPVAATDEVDEVDTAASDAFEALVAATLAGMAVDAMSGPASVLPGGGDWTGRIQGALGFAIKAYLIRAAFRLLSASGVTGPAAAEIVDAVVPEAEAQAIARLGASLNGLVEKASSRAAEATPGLSAPSGSDPAVEAGEGPSATEAATEAYRRLRVGSAQLARETSTALREGIRSELAAGLGATQKTWRTRMDPKVRVSHGALEGETVGMFEPFTTVSGAQLAFPGDPTAPIGEVANCRCRLSYSIPVGPDRYEAEGKVVQIRGPETADIQRGDRVYPIAAAGENDAWEDQLRDANGRWVQMGSTVSFEHVGSQRTGQVIGSPKEGYLRVRTKSGYVIDVPARRATVRAQPKARLRTPTPAKKAPAKKPPAKKPAARANRERKASIGRSAPSKRRDSSGTSRDPRLSSTRELFDSIEDAITLLARKNGRRDPFREKKSGASATKDAARIDARKNRRGAAKKTAEYGKSSGSKSSKDKNLKKLTRFQIDKVNSILKAALEDVKEGSASGALSKLAAAKQVLTATSAPWLVLRIDELTEALKAAQPRKPKARTASGLVAARRHRDVVPGIPGRSESWRTQLRDRNGKWIEMGSEVKWLLNGVLKAGRVVDSSGPDRATVEVDGRRLDLPANKLSVSAPPKAELPGAPDAPEAPTNVPDAPDLPRGPDMLAKAPKEALVGARGVADDIEAAVETPEGRAAAARAVATIAVARMADRVPDLRGRFEGSWADKAAAAQEVLLETVALNHDVVDTLVSKGLTWVDEYIAPSSPGVGGFIEQAFGIPNPFSDPAGFVGVAVELFTAILEALMGLIA